MWIMWVVSWTRQVSSGSRLWLRLGGIGGRTGSRYTCRYLYRYYRLYNTLFERQGVFAVELGSFLRVNPREEECKAIEGKPGRSYPCCACLAPHKWVHRLVQSV